MCLAEALLRIPDKATMDKFISDKLSTVEWKNHLSRENPLFVNAATWSLLLTGKIYAPTLNNEDGWMNSLSRTVSRLGASVIRPIILQMMKAIGAQFVMGQTIDEAMKRADEEEREAYKDVMAVIIEAQKGDDVLRQVIRQRFQTLKSQTALAKWAARFEVKTTAKQIRTINAITAKLPSLKGGSLAKKLPDLLTQAKYAIHDAFHESFLIQKRAIYWILNVLYNLYLLRDMGYRYVKSHFMPEKPQAEEVRHIDEIIAHILKDFRTVAQGYRIIISHLESGEKELQKIEQQAMAR